MYPRINETKYTFKQSSHGYSFASCGSCPRGVVANILNCHIEVSDPLEKGMNPITLPAMGVRLLFFYKDGFGIK